MDLAIQAYVSSFSSSIVIIIIIISSSSSSSSSIILIFIFLFIVVVIAVAVTIGVGAILLLQVNARLPWSCNVTTSNVRSVTCASTGGPKGARTGASGGRHAWLGSFYPLIRLSCRAAPSLPLTCQGQYDIAKPEQGDPEDEEVLIAREAL